MNYSVTSLIHSCLVLMPGGRCQQSVGHMAFQASHCWNFCVSCLCEGEKNTLLKGKTFDLESVLFLDLYSIVRVSIWLRLTGWNFAGKVRTSLKLRPMTTKCLQCAGWHIINNSSVALDGAQPKESMNSPRLHPAVPFGKTPFGYCPGPGFWMFISPTSCVYPVVYFFFQLYKAFKWSLFPASFQERRCKMNAKWMQKRWKTSPSIGYLPD